MENEYEIDSAFKEWEQNIGNKGHLVHSMEHPITLNDKTNIKLLYGNYKSSQRLRTAIERFDKSSTVLSRRMLILAYIMTFLVSVQILIMLFPLLRGLVKLFQM